MTSYPLGKIRCTSCGSFINRKYGAYRSLIQQGYSRVKAFEALHVPRYCCRAHLENPDIITVSLTTKEVTDVENYFIKRLGDEEGKIAAANLVYEMLDIDPYNLEDPTSLVNDIHTERMVSSVLAGTFAKKIEKIPIIKISNEQISAAKRENMSVQVSRDEAPAFDEDGNIVKRRPLPIIIRPSRPETRKQELEQIKVSTGKKVPRRTVQTTAKSSMFAVGSRPKRAAVGPAKKGAKGEGIYETTRKEPLPGSERFETIEERMRVRELKKGEEAPEGYKEVSVVGGMFNVGYKSAKRSAVRRAQEGEEGENIYEVRGSKAIETEEGEAIIPTYRVEARELEEGEEVPEGYREAYVTKPTPFAEVPKKYKLVGERK